MTGLPTPVCLAIAAVGATPNALLALYYWRRKRTYQKGQRA